MNRTEANSIVSYLNRAGLVGAMEGQAAVWADALEDISFKTAQEVARRFAKERTSTQRWVTPGDVTAEVKRIRAERHSVWNKPRMDPPAELGDDVALDLAWRRAWSRAVGDGEPDPDAAADRAVGITRRPVIEDTRPVPQLVDQLARGTRIRHE